MYHFRPFAHKLKDVSLSATKLFVFLSDGQPSSSILGICFEILLLAPSVGIFKRIIYPDPLRLGHPLSQYLSNLIGCLQFGVIRSKIIPIQLDHPVLSIFLGFQNIIRVRHTWRYLFILDLFGSPNSHRDMN